MNRRYGLWLAGIFASASLFGATDPFVGTWVYNAQESPKPTIRYAIKDLGGRRYALTGSTGVTVEIKADGIPIKTPDGDTVAFRQLDDYDWEMVRDEDGQKMVRTYTMSPDDKTLALHDVFTGHPGDNYETIVKYARLSPGKSIFGDWQSVSLEEKNNGEVLKLIIAPFANDGLSFSIPAHKHLSEMRFDGQPYVDKGAGDTKDRSSSGKRVSNHLLRIDAQVSGKLDEREELTVSDNGKRLTILRRPSNSSAVFTMVWDRL